MKNRLDAPSTDDIVQVRQSVRGDAVFQITPFGEKVVMEYGKSLWPSRFRSSAKHAEKGHAKEETT